jgi:hypothetical protein
VRLWSFGRNTTEVMLCAYVILLGGAQFWCFIIGDHLKMVSIRSSPVQFLFSLCNENYSEAMWINQSSLNFYPLVVIAISYPNYLSPMALKDDFINSIIASTLISILMLALLPFIYSLTYFYQYVFLDSCFYLDDYNMLVIFTCYDALSSPDLAISSPFKLRIVIFRHNNMVQAYPMFVLLSQPWTAISPGVLVLFME